MASPELAEETPPPASRSLNPFRVLQQYRNFRLFWSGQTISLIGSWMQQVAVGWTALELSNDPLLVGLAAAAGTFPILLFSLPGGVVADRSEKLRVVRIAQSLMLVEATALWALAATGHLTIHWLLTLALFGGTLAAFEIPARQSLIVELVNKEDVPAAIGLNSTGFNLARVLGPSISAVVIAKGGVEWAFGLNALSYLAVLIGLAMIRLPERRKFARHPAGSLAGMKEALVYVWRTPPLPMLLLIASVFSLLGIPVLTLLPIVARDVLGVGPQGYGALMACIGLGAVAGALYIAATGGGARRGHTLRIASVVYPALLVSVSLVRQPFLVGALLFCVGTAMIVNNALVNALLQEIVPDELRGRVLSLYVMLYIGASPVGSFLAGAVAKATSTAWAIGGAAALMLLFALWIFRRHPGLSSDRSPVLSAL
ncbi:MAG: MFS transporter [Gemmatimonadaceae bacterium]